MSTAPKQQAKAQQPAASERSQPAQAQPARTAAASDALVILNWKNFSKGALVGFFDLVIANGMILVDCKLFAKGDARWVGWPNRKTTGKDGTDVYIPYVKFISRDHADRMRDRVLAALDADSEVAAARNASSGSGSSSSKPYRADDSDIPDYLR